MMMRRPVVLSVAFVALAGLHVGVPLSTLRQRAAILRDGTEIRLAFTAADPRTLLRAEPTTLTYALGSLRGVPVSDDERARCTPARDPAGRPPPALPADCATIPAGADVFVILDAGKSGAHRAASVALRRPPSGKLFLRGRIRNAALLRSDGACQGGRCISGQVQYGIETWLGPPEGAAKVDRAPRGDPLAVVRVDSSGTAVVKELMVNGQRIGGP